MKKDRAIYWATTGMVLFVMAYSIITFTFFNRALYPEGAFVHLQLPNYFRIELTVAKTFGVLALLIPSVPLKVKEFAYFGFAITLVSASIAHFAVGDAGRPPLYAFYIVDPLISWVCSSFPTGTSTSLRGLPVELSLFAFELGATGRRGHEGGHVCRAPSSPCWRLRMPRKRGPLVRRP